MSTESPDVADMINAVHQGTHAGALGLLVESATKERVTATLVVRGEHRQPQGIVHGGVYAAIIESLASVGGAINAMAQGKTVVGLENHTSFIRAVREGTLRAHATPITRGRRSQLWEVTIKNEADAIVATGRVRLLVLEADAEVAGVAIGRGE